MKDLLRVSGYSRTDAGELPVTCDRSADLEGPKIVTNRINRHPKDHHCKRGAARIRRGSTNLLFTDKRMPNRELEHSQGAEADIDFVSMVLSFKKCSPE